MYPNDVDGRTKSYNINNSSSSGNKNDIYLSSCSRCHQQSIPSSITKTSIFTVHITTIFDSRMCQNNQCAMFWNCHSYIHHIFPLLFHFCVISFISLVSFVCLGNQIRLWFCSHSSFLFSSSFSAYNGHKYQYYFFHGQTKQNETKTKINIFCTNGYLFGLTFVQWFLKWK